MAENQTDSALALRHLETALEAAQSRVADADSQMGALRQARAIAQEEANLLQKLISLRQGRVVNSSDGPHKTGEQTSPRQKKEGERHPMLLGVIDILHEAAQPLHVAELMRLAKERGIEIPGAGTQANLISYLRRDDAIVRPSRGIYGLAEWGIEEMTYAKKRKSRRKKTRTRIGTQN